MLIVYIYTLIKQVDSDDARIIIRAQGQFSVCRMSYGSTVCRMKSYGKKPYTIRKRSQLAVFHTGNLYLYGLTTIRSLRTIQPLRTLRFGSYGRPCLSYGYHVHRVCRRALLPCCPPAYLPTWLSVYLSTCLPVYLSTCLPLRLSA